MTTGKHFSDEDLVSSSLLGLVRCSNAAPLRLLRPFPEVRVVVRADVEPASFGRVALVSGGGSGHEPGQVGYVGQGMLTAAVCGDVFASPSAEAVYRAIKATTGSAGCLLIVMNYTGDRLNFGLAAERAKAEGLSVEMVVVGEDVALPRKKTGRRGLAGTVAVHKACGALAERGASLEEVKAAGEAVAASMGTMGVSLTTCTIPGQPASGRLGPTEMEVGLGIHGEPGREKRPVASGRDVARAMCDAVAKPGSNEYFEAPVGEEVVLLVNNLGATTPIEMTMLAGHCLDHCRGGLGLRVSRLLVGPFKTSLDMVGASVSLIRANVPGVGDFLELLDAPTKAPAWPKDAGREPPASLEECFRDGGEDGGPSTRRPAAGGAPDLGDGEREAARGAILGACKEVSACRELCDGLDRLAGDGDCGSTLAKGAAGIAADVEGGKFDFSTGSSLASCIASSVLRHMGGTSGAIYNIFFQAASTSLGASEGGGSKYEAFAAAMAAGLKAIQKYGGAQPGDRTLVDALHPFVHSLSASSATTPEAIEADLRKALALAEEGAEGTKAMTDAILGRASYVPEKDLEGNADPGAVAACAWLKGMIEGLRQGR
ncbi:dihydroxyacetone kinase [Chloropicon primus]|uniref:Dihydroxyacetone kinase n=2 Tax=Chloropicon primus TaxID=1764295 RepID=A0A5B8MNN8_9CHLO|nr:dihydroxyacetone kinase [Chloropicon primus]UPR00387.1 dihydroxyacetone kinase [Chloropicon primus]|eukprot:QDZ21175.1 dihydroxyacetone kinase [Chloropicon primus]